jgi:membrane-associated protein
MEIINFLLHLLKDPLATLQDFLAHYQALTYFLVALIIFVETGLIVMPILPGDSLLFAVGLLASSTGQLDITTIIPLLIAAALLGDNVNYYVGKNFSRFIENVNGFFFSNMNT